MSDRLSDRRTLPSLLHAEALGLAGLLARETGDGVAIVGPVGELIHWIAAAGASRSRCSAPRSPPRTRLRS